MTDLNELAPPRYPEHEKMAEVKEDSHRLGAFIDWLQGQGIGFAHWVESDFSTRTHDEATEHTHKRVNHEDRLVPIHRTINEWLSLYYAIDLQKIEDEKEQMLAEIRRANRRR